MGDKSNKNERNNIKMPSLNGVVLFFIYILVPNKYYMT